VVVHRNPRLLIFVATTFFAVAAISLFRSLEAFVEGGFYFDLGLIGFFIGGGLLRRSRAWRVVAYVFASFGVAICFLSLSR
jgi:hypothetical protein